MFTLFLISISFSGFRLPQHIFLLFLLLQCQLSISRFFNFKFKVSNLNFIFLHSTWADQIVALAEPLFLWLQILLNQKVLSIYLWRLLNHFVMVSTFFFAWRLLVLPSTFNFQFLISSIIHLYDLRSFLSVIVIVIIIISLHSNIF